MKLTFLEKSMLGTILPMEGDWVTLTAVRELQASLIPTDKELEEIDGKYNPDGSIHYAPSKDKEREVAITSIQAKIIKDRLIKLESEKKLNFKILSLYEKFVGVNNG